jgi:hypothetical protein
MRLLKKSGVRPLFSAAFQRLRLNFEAIWYRESNDSASLAGPSPPANVKFC